MEELRLEANDGGQLRLGPALLHPKLFQSVDARLVGLFEQVCGLAFKLGGADELGVEERVMGLDVGEGHIVLQSTIVLIGRVVKFTHAPLRRISDL